MLGFLRTIRAIFPLGLAGLSILFLIGYGRAIYPIWDGRSGDHHLSDLGLLTEPHVVVYRAYCHRCGERDGWSLFWVFDAPEGTRPVLYFPSWPLAIVAFGALIYAGFAIYDQSGRR